MRGPSEAPGRDDRHQQTTILFADMIGFTAFCAENHPSVVMNMLRGLFAILVGEIAAHGGRTEKLLGDGLMAVFVPEDERGCGAAAAIRCAIAIQTAVDRWNARSGRRIKIAIGLHSGPVTTGRIGAGVCQEFAVIGDAVNIASRVEGKCRSLDASILLTSDVVAEARREGAAEATERLADFGMQQLRGRKARLHLFGMKRSGGAGWAEAA
jgi:adenylate cyclase